VLTAQGAAILFIPLYTAIRKDKVLDHFFRGRLYEYIMENPGITYTALKKHFDVNNGTLTYHLHKLEKEEILAHRNVGKYKLFYPDGVKMRGADVVISVLDKEILEIVSDNPGITTSRIISDLKGTRSKRTLSRHIKDLERKELIEIVKDGGDRRAYLSEGWDKVILSSKGVTDMREDLSLDV
jgi:predicted transcriptional regulator